jgi:hypothetical protein
MGGGANRPSLAEAQIAFQKLGAIDESVLEHVRAPTAGDQRDPGWRPLDLDRDAVEVPKRGVDYGGTYPGDSATLYYWRRDAV